MASNEETTLRIRIPPFTVSPDISPISFYDEDAQVEDAQVEDAQVEDAQVEDAQVGEQENQEQGDQESDYYGDYEDYNGKVNRKDHPKVFRKVLRKLFHMKAPPSNVRSRVQKNGRASKMCSVSKKSAWLA
jgi:hypothetical protein